MQKTEENICNILYNIKILIKQHYVTTNQVCGQTCSPLFPCKIIYPAHLSFGTTAVM